MNADVQQEPPNYGDPKWLALNRTRVTPPVSADQQTERVAEALRKHYVMRGLDAEFCGCGWTGDDFVTHLARAITAVASGKTEEEVAYASSLTLVRALLRAGEKLDRVRALAGELEACPADYWTNGYQRAAARIRAALDGDATTGGTA